jgi:Putative endonuclease segE, GIY-YIG domain
LSWIYNGKELDELPIGCEAFVYLITNNTNGMMYVGKKLAKFKVTKAPLKGKKNKRHSTKESDWREYWGSSDRLKADVELLGPENFTREILHFCPSRGIASYLEAREQFERRVLETDDYYNGIINVRIGGSNILKEHLKNIR